MSFCSFFKQYSAYINLIVVGSDFSRLFLIPFSCHLKSSMKRISFGLTLFDQSEARALSHDLKKQLQLNQIEKIKRKKVL